MGVENNQTFSKVKEKIFQDLMLLWSNYSAD